jgi:Lon protease-like protein
MPLNIFEPRYVAMVDAAVAGDRVIGMVQPDENARPCALGPVLRTVGCAGRIVSLAETGDGRYVITLTGIARFRIVEELALGTPFRQCRVTAAPFAGDFVTEASAVDRNAVLRAFRAYLDAHKLDADWESVGRASDDPVNVLVRCRSGRLETGRSGLDGAPRPSSRSPKCRSPVAAEGRGAERVLQ